MGVLQYSNGATIGLELGRVIAVWVTLYAMEVELGVGAIVCWTSHTTTSCTAWYQEPTSLLLLLLH